MTLPASKIREKLYELASQKNRIEDSLANVEKQIVAGKLLSTALDQMVNTKRYYASAPDKVRRLLNESFFHFSG